MDPTPPAQTEQTIRQLMDRLALADPQAARRMNGHLTASEALTDARGLGHMVDEVIEALAVEVTFGRILAEGVGRMLAAGQRVDLHRYLEFVKGAAVKGPTLAGLFARHLVPVLLCGDARLVDRFETATRTMLTKGTYTLKAPLEALSLMIEERDLAGAHAFLDLLSATYALDISYNRSVYLTHTLPRAVGSFVRQRRLWQIRGLTRIIREDERLADDYLRGLTAGLHLLSEAALNEFLSQAVGRYQKDRESGARFLSLDTQGARETCRELQVAVPLSAVRSGLERYLHARTGLAVAVRPYSALSEEETSGLPDACLVRCDGRSIHLPDEMNLKNRRTDNATLYKLLVRLEAGAIEFGTYDLDLEKALAKTPFAAAPEPIENRAVKSDLRRLLDRCECPDLALDLFTLLEHGRIARQVGRCYPGLFRRLVAAFSGHAQPAGTGQPAGGTLWPLYCHLVIAAGPKWEPVMDALFQAMTTRFHRVAAGGSHAVEDSARLTLEFQAQLADLTRTGGVDTYASLRLPFGRRFEPERFGPFHQTYHRLATDIHHRLASRDIRVYRSDIHSLLVRQDGQVSALDLAGLTAGLSPASDNDLAWLDLASLFCDQGLTQPAGDADPDHAFRYREWDWCMGDYLPDRVRVLERDINASDPEFYRDTLDTFRGLVKRIRYAFELLRPEEMTILRQWREGDAFDYRALLDYALDRKAGLMPSDRLFIKRMKRIRDVAVLLLVDLSRSTANAVDDRGTRVLDVEKQAIVLLCEALAVVGDRFAIAGFSGTGPLGVDYFRIKALDEPFDAAVKGRVSVMAPQRSTRMGAAIRHATARLTSVQARVRLILLLGDGFPNDLAYKGRYAVEDTRRAIMEARAEAVHVKAITVNVSDNSQLDRLYGPTHHTLITNIHDLPDKLVRVYSALTRH